MGLTLHEKLIQALAEGNSSSNSTIASASSWAGIVSHARRSTPDDSRVEIRGRCHDLRDWERVRERGREGEREGGRDGGRERGREGERESEGETEGGRELGAV